MIQDIHTFSRREVLKGTLASLVGSIFQGGGPLPGFPPELHDSPTQLLNGATGLAKILMEANQFVGSFYNFPIRQSVTRLAQIIRPELATEHSSIDPARALAIEITSQIPGTGESNRSFIHDLLNLDSASRKEALEKIRAAKSGLQKLATASVAENSEIRSLVAKIYFDQNCTSDCGFITSALQPLQYLEENCKDPDDYFKSLVVKAIRSLDAERILFEEGFRIFQIAANNQSLRRAVAKLKECPHLPDDVVAKVQSDLHPSPPKMELPQKSSPTVDGDLKSISHSTRLEKQDLIEGILDGTIESYSIERLKALLKGILSADNLTTSNHDGLMSRLAAEGLVFRIDSSALLGGESLPQVDMIWVDNTEELPRSFNLTYQGRKRVVEALNYILFAGVLRHKFSVVESSSGH